MGMYFPFSRPEVCATTEGVEILFQCVTGDKGAEGFPMGSGFRAEVPSAQWCCTKCRLSSRFGRLLFMISLRLDTNTADENVTIEDALRSLCLYIERAGHLRRLIIETWLFVWKIGH
jgi:hypothetical protein